MPTYDYQCKSCEHKFEQFQSFKDSVLTRCPKCEKDELQRLIGVGAGFIVRGGTGSFSAASAGMREFYSDSSEQKLNDRLMELDE